MLEWIKLLGIWRSIQMGYRRLRDAFPIFSELANCLTPLLEHLREVTQGNRIINHQGLGTGITIPQSRVRIVRD